MNRWINFARGILLLTVMATNALFFPVTTYASQSLVWQTTTPLPQGLASHIAYAFNGNVFILGGAADNGIPAYLFSESNTSGLLSPWTSLPPVSLFWQAGAVKDNYFYMLGGANHPPAKYFDTVSLGKMQADGRIIEWIPVTPLPKKAAMGAATIIGERLYFAGGFNNDSGTVIHQDIYYATISQDGSISNWQHAGILPAPLYGFGMTSHNDHLIIIGGYNGADYSASTYKSALNPDGTIGPWQTLTPLPEPSYRASVIKVDTELYVIGGSVTTKADKVYSAPINTDATLEAWALNENRLPQPLWGGAITSVNNYLYLTGGYNGTYLNTVYYAKIEPDTPQQEGLNVPLFSQNELPWGDEEYDHTKELGLQNETMNRWGCAVTSAAMVLQYHGMHEMPDQKEINPGTINEWLKNNNGYAYGSNKSGWYSGIRWNAISRLSKELYDAGKSQIKLELSIPKKTSDLFEPLNTDLTTGNEYGRYPDIIHVTELAGKSTKIGHYVVATGKNDDTFTINDPEWEFPSLESFNNHFDQLIRYIPSRTDLSYIEIAVNPTIEINVTDPDGYKTGQRVDNGLIQIFDEIPNATYTFIEPLANPDINGNSEVLGTGYNEFLLPKPKNGKYNVTFSSNEYTDYTVNLAVYDKDGKNTIRIIKGTVGINQDDSLEINYTPDSAEISRFINFQTVIQDINEAHNLGFITTKGAANSLTTLMQNAEKSYNKGKTAIMQTNLETFEKLLNVFKNMSITPQAYNILFTDLQNLRTTINL